MDEEGRMKRLSLAPSLMSDERTAKFTLQGFVAARTPEAGQKTVDALAKISMVIIEAYKATSEQSNSREQKMAGIQKVVNLLPDLEWLESFCADEAQYCRVPQERLKLTETYKKIAGKVNSMRQEFRVLRQNGENFQLVFSTILEILDMMTNFMQTGHGAGVSNAQDINKGAQLEADGLLNCEFVNVLVTQAKQCLTRLNESLNACQSLINTQDEAEKDALSAQLSSVEDRARAALQGLIMATKAIFQKTGTKADQEKAHSTYAATLKEVHAILDRIKANYTSAFDVTEARRRLALQMGDASAPSGDTRMTGDLIQAAKDMADALSRLGLSLDRPPEKVPVPKLAMIMPEQKSAKGDLIQAAKDLNTSLAGVNKSLDK